VENQNDAGTVTMRVEYQYDAWDRMTRRKYDQDGDAGAWPVQTEYYMHDGSERIMYIVPDSWQSHFYMFNPATDEVLFSQTDGVYATLTDHLGTVHDLVNQASTVVNHFVYDAFGNMVGGTAQVHWRNRIGFAGAFFEAATGLQYNHHRWYDPQAGRWISEDPIGFDGGDSNLARYVGNHVTTQIDPSGLQSPAFKVAEQAGIVTTAAAAHQRAFDRLVAASNRLVQCMSSGKGREAAQKAFDQARASLSQASKALKDANDQLRIGINQFSGGTSQYTQTLNNAVRQRDVLSLKAAEISRFANLSTHQLSQSLASGQARQLSACFERGGDWSKVSKDSMERYFELARRAVAEGIDTSGKQADRLKTLAEKLGRQDWLAD
jgi:RHS repeat-associated protein